MSNIFTNLTVFDGFEIAPVVKVDELKDGTPVYEQLADWIEGRSSCDFWTVYGHYDPTDFNNGVAHANVGLEALVDCTTREQAEHVRKYFETFRTQQLDALAAGERFEEVCDDEEITDATHVIDAMMEHMNALEWEITGGKS